MDIIQNPLFAVSLAILIVATGWILAGVVNLIKTFKKDVTRKNMVHVPRFVLIMGIAGTLLFMILSVFALVEKDNDAIWVCAITLLPLSLVVLYINFAIICYDTYFVYRNFWGIKRSFSYTDITGITSGISSITLHIGKKKIHLDIWTVGLSRFFSVIRNKRKEVGLPRTLPEIKTKLFNDNIHNPGEFIFFMIIGVILCGILGIFAILHPDKEMKILLLCLVGAFVMINIIIPWYLMSNAEKYPKLVRMFIKSEYIKKKDQGHKRRKKKFKVKSSRKMQKKR